jgi:hypothetical protein
MHEDAYIVPAGLHLAGEVDRVRPTLLSPRLLRTKICLRVDHRRNSLADIGAGTRGHVARLRCGRQNERAEQSRPHRGNAQCDTNRSFHHESSDVDVCDYLS